MEAENISGMNLVNVDKADTKGWGVKDFDHKQTLFNHAYSNID